MRHLQERTHWLWAQSIASVFSWALLRQMQSKCGYTIQNFINQQTLKAMTKTIESLEFLPKLYATDGMHQREVQIVFYHMFTPWTWYVVEGEKQEDGDWLFFTWCKSAFEGCDEWGYVRLSQLQEIPAIKFYVPERPLVIDDEGNILD